MNPNSMFEYGAFLMDCVDDIINHSKSDLHYLEIIERGLILLSNESDLRDRAKTYLHELSRLQSYKSQLNIKKEPIHPSSGLHVANRYFGLLLKHFEAGTLLDTVPIEMQADAREFAETIQDTQLDIQPELFYPPTCARYKSPVLKEAARLMGFIS